MDNNYDLGCELDPSELEKMQEENNRKLRFLISRASRRFQSSRSIVLSADGSSESPVLTPRRTSNSPSPKPRSRYRSHSVSYSVHRNPSPVPGRGRRSESPLARRNSDVVKEQFAGLVRQASLVVLEAIGKDQPQPQQKPLQRVSSDSALRLKQLGSWSESQITATRRSTTSEGEDKAAIQSLGDEDDDAVADDNKIELTFPIISPPQITTTLPETPPDIEDNNNNDNTAPPHQLAAESSNLKGSHWRSDTNSSGLTSHRHGIFHLGHILPSFTPSVSTPPRIRVFVATWNAGNSPPNKSQFDSWLPMGLISKCDLVAVGLQECSYISTNNRKKAYLKQRAKTHDSFTTSTTAGLNKLKPERPDRGSRRLSDAHGFSKNMASNLASDLHRVKSFVHNNSALEVETSIQQHIGSGFRKLASVHFGQMSLVVLCRSEIKPHISHVKKAHKSTGIGHVIANKGGLMVKCKIFGTDICFLSCHLNAHESEEKVTRRNQDVREILRATSKTGKQHLDIAQRYDCTFLFGDLNYRINLAISDEQHDKTEHRNRVLDLIETKQFDALYKADQLRRELNAKHVLCGFQETPPNFEPTFKVQKGQTLEYKDTRIPSYCDRILWTAMPGRKHEITQSLYRSANHVTSSDHKPVYSIFDIDVSHQDETIDSSRAHTANKHFTHYKRGLRLDVSRLKILNVLDELASAVDVTAKFSGAVLMSEKTVRSRKPSESEDSPLVDRWIEPPQLAIKVSQDALYDKHVIISLWDKNKKLVGQSVLSLNQQSRDASLQTFKLEIILYGVAQGELTGCVALRDPVSAHFSPRRATRCFSNQQEKKKRKASLAGGASGGMTPKPVAPHVFAVSESFCQRLNRSTNILSRGPAPNNPPRLQLNDKPC